MLYDQIHYYKLEPFRDYFMDYAHYVTLFLEVEGGEWVEIKTAT
jgi:hypothetical protein